LLVADETALAGTKLLHPGEHLRAALLGQVEPELFRLDPDRGEAALLAEDDPSLRPDELGGVGLDRRRIVELARDRAALAVEVRLACHRLPRLELVTGQLAYTLGDLTDAVQPKVRLDPVERAEGERHLAEVRVSRPLAHAVDRSLDPGRTRPHRSDRGGGREAEVVMAVEVHGDVGPDPLDRAPDEIGDRLRAGNPERVDDADLLR